MAAKRTPTPKKKKASGENIENWQRKTKQVLLRLPPEIDDMLREAADDQGMKLNAYVVRLLTVMREHPEVPCGTLLEDLRGPFR